MSLKSILDTYDAAPHAFCLLTVGEEIDKAAREGGLSDVDGVLVQAEIDGLLFAERKEDANGPDGLYYRPRMVFSTKSGGTVEFPSLKSVTGATIAYWQRRSSDAKHPVFRARYADLVWELTQYATGALPAHQFAQLAIDATLDIAKLPVPDGQLLDVYRKIARALSLALALNDQPRIALVRDAIIAFEKAHGRHDHVGTWGFAFDLLIDKRNIPLSATQETDIVNDLETRLAMTSIPGAPAFTPWGAEAAARRLAHYYTKRQRADDVRRVITAQGGAYRDLAAKASPLVSSSWLRQVHDAYLQFGMRAEADALQPLISVADRAAVGDLKTMKTSVEIPGEKVRAFAAAITKGSLAETLARIAAKFVVDKEQTQIELQKFAAEFPVQFLFPRHLLDAAGRTEAILGSLDQDLDGHVVAQMAQAISLNHFFLIVATTEMRARFSPTASDICAYLFQSPIFEAPYQQLVKRGVEAYLSNDYIACVHILIPQIEQAIRKLALLLGRPHLAPGRHGGTQLRLLHVLLSDSAIGEALTPSIRDYFVVVLVDQRGLNLRNSISHGYVPAAEFGPMMADLVFHVLLVLGLVHEEKREAGSDPATPI